MAGTKSISSLAMTFSEGKNSSYTHTLSQNFFFPYFVIAFASCFCKGEGTAGTWVKRGGYSLLQNQHIPKKLNIKLHCFSHCFRPK